MTNHTIGKTFNKSDSRDVIIFHSRQLSYHTNVGEILTPLHGYHLPLHWLVTDLDCSQFPKKFQTDEPILIAGSELDRIMKEDFQVTWGVFSGFRLEIHKIDVPCPFPVAEHPNIWSEDYSIQHPQAECELICWDSSATFFRSKDQAAMRLFSRSFPEALTLDEFDRKAL